ncbi:MAG TPA: ATP-binding protein [Candidatus Sumerlaeota bacterium]|nr:ATP-binding protein [Candidatus Sumerlaeota bacterium]HOR26452.1 ATP-binding protein [Candidatus Sumerlaeota bacterium]HPK00836.1 ATP-binding protein [Candidatus Sumerlaeota bacterium]
MDRLYRNPPGWIVYSTLALCWLLIVVWLAFEHARVRRMEREALLNRARDISNTIALVTRAGVPGLIFQSRLEEALEELVDTTELEAATLLNAAGEVVASAGGRELAPLEQLPQRAVRWQTDSVVVVNLVDFGRRMEDDGTTLPATIVLPRREDWPTTGFRERFNDDAATRGEIGRFSRRRSRDRDADSERIGPPPRPQDEGEPGDRAGPGDRGRDRDFFRRGSIRPPWMSEERYRELIATRGLHGFILELSTDALREQLRRDRWLRVTLALGALLAVGGLGLGWRGFERATRLRMRLLRAQEMNEHLREMNLAAAGLAHETRNPLNIVRGLAQMIEKRPDLPAETAGQLRRIAEEVDQITFRLNEFIKFSRPPEPRIGAVALLDLCRNVIENLRHDLDEKQATIDLAGEPVQVAADEALLRQVVFNLLLNAVQAIDTGGRIRVGIEPAARDAVVLTVADSGPGIPPELHESVFRPYYTTRADGAGLGLAVVRQIVLAHQWEVAIAPADLGGAAFRISGLRLVRPPSQNAA